MRHIILIFAACAAYGQQWSALPNSTFNSSMCVANGFSGSTCGSSGQPAGCSGAGTPYPYQTTCAAAVFAYNGGVARTKRGSEQLVIFGGGHGDSGDNSVFAIDVGANPGTPAARRIKDPSYIDVNSYCPLGTGTGAGCTTVSTLNIADGSAITVNTASVGDGTSTVTWSAGTTQFTVNMRGASLYIDLSANISGGSGKQWLVKSYDSATQLTLYQDIGNHTGYTVAIAASGTSARGRFVADDGAPASVHTYNNLAYIDENDPYYPDSMFVYGGSAYGTGEHSSYGWIYSFANNTWKLVLPNRSAGVIPPAPAYISAPTFYDPTTHKVWILQSGVYILSVDLSACTGTGPVTCTYVNNGVTGMGNEGAAFDSLRQRIVAIGNGAAITTSLTTFAETNVAGSLSASCSSIVSAVGPGLAYDPKYDLYIAWTGNSSGSLYYINPSTWTCTPVAYGGSAPPNSGGAILGAGFYGKLQYFPSLGKLVTLPDFNQSTYALQLEPLGSGSPVHPYKCVDHDGDGYGTGEVSSDGCLGKDSDDEDAAIHASPTLINAESYFRRRRYTPSRWWIVDGTNGNDATGAVCTVLASCAPYQTYLAIYFLGVQPGDAVVFRAGTYTERLALFSGLPGKFTYYLAYPGETVTWSGLTTDARGKSWWIIDGFGGSGNKRILSDADQDGEGNPLGITHAIVRNFESTDICTYGFNAMADVWWEDMSCHDSTGGTHAFYIGARAWPLYRVTIQRSLFYRNPWSGVHINGRSFNTLIQNNIFWSNELNGFDPQNGVANSTVRDNLFFNNGRGITWAIYTAETDCSDPTADKICTWDQSYNLIEGNTFYQTGYLYNGTLTAIGPLYYGSQHATWPKDQGHMTYRNNIFVQKSADEPPIRVNYNLSEGVSEAPERAWLATTVFDHNIMQGTDGNAITFIDMSPGITTNYTYAQFAAMTTLQNGSVAVDVQNVDPQFVSASPTYYNTEASFDFNLVTGSPAKFAGGAGASFDLKGYPHPTVPSLGALEYQGAPSCSLSGTLPAATVGSAYTGNLTASGCISSAYTQSGLGTGACSGLSLNGSTGAITGTPTTAGTCSFTGSYDTVIGRAFSITVSAAPAGGASRYSGSFTGTIR